MSLDTHKKGKRPAFEGGRSPKRRENPEHAEATMSNTKARKDEREPREALTPEAPDSERQLLIAVLEHRTIPAEVEEVLPEDFSHPREQRIFRLMRELDKSGKLTFDELSGRLTRAEAGGVKPEEGIVAYLSTLNGEVAVPLSLLARYVAQIKGAAREREIRDYHREALAKLDAGELDADAHIRESKEKLERWEATPSSDIKPVSAQLDEVNENIFNAEAKPVPTFSARLNKNLNGGLQRGKVLTIAAAAGLGKTTFALQLVEETVREQSKRSTCVGVYVSMEMSREELVTRSYSRLGLVDSGKIEGKTIKREDLADAMKRYREEVAPVMYLVEAREGMTLAEVRGIARKVKARLSKISGEDTGDVFVILCVDPFQRLRTGEPEIDREEISRVGALGSGLKKLAGDLDVSVILLSDTTKEAAKIAEAGGRGGQGIIRGSYMATHTTDLQAEIIVWKEQEDLEQYMREDYGALVQDFPLANFDNYSLPVYAVLDFSKNRSGGRSRCPFVWQKAYNRFIPVGKDQTEHEGGLPEWEETWSVKLRRKGIPR